MLIWGTGQQLQKEPIKEISAASLKRRKVLIAALVAGAISIPLSLWGYMDVYGITHSGVLLLIPFIPAFLVSALCHKYICGPGPVMLALMLLAQFAGYFLVTLAVIRLCTRKNKVPPNQ